jgi:hypothetical protein
MGFTINVYTGCSDFPENTYTSDDLSKVLDVANDVLSRSITGIHRVEILDDNPLVSRHHVGMCPMEV